METHLIILFGFMLVLICTLGLDAAASKYDIRTLRARLDRRDALEAKTAKSPANCAKPKVYTSQLDAWAEAISVKELKARLSEKDETIKQQCKDISVLVTRIFEKDETIKNLNGDIAKLKFDYAAEVADRNETIKILKPERGITADEFTEIKREDFDKLKPRKKTNDCECCAGSGENRLGDECATCCGTGQNNPIKHKSPDENTDGRV